MRECFFHFLPFSSFKQLLITTKLYQMSVTLGYFISLGSSRLDFIWWKRDFVMLQASPRLHWIFRIYQLYINGTFFRHCVLMGSSPYLTFWAWLCKVCVVYVGTAVLTVSWANQPLQTFSSVSLCWAWPQNVLLRAASSRLSNLWDLLKPRFHFCSPLPLSCYGCSLAFSCISAFMLIALSFFSAGKVLYTSIHKSIFLHLFLLFFLLLP